MTSCSPRFQDGNLDHNLKLAESQGALTPKLKLTREDPADIERAAPKGAARGDCYAAPHSER